MKRIYQKPMLLLERFELKQSITQSCTAASLPSVMGKPNSADKLSCGWEIATNMVLWLGEPSSPCTIPLAEDATGNDLCYNNPGSGYTIFSS